MWMQEYEEIASLYMEKWMEDLESTTKESLPELLAKIYFYTKETISAETGVDVLKTSSFCNFLKELNSLARKHLQVIHHTSIYRTFCLKYLTKINSGSVEEESTGKL